MIIIRGDLSECYLDDKNEIQIEPISRCFLFNDVRIEETNSPCINIIHIDYLDEFIKEAHEFIAQIDSLTYDAASEILDGMTRQIP